MAFLPAEVSQGDRRSWSVYACPHPPEPHATLASLELTRASPQEAGDLSVSPTFERLMCSHLVSRHSQVCQVANTDGKHIVRCRQANTDQWLLVKGSAFEIVKLTQKLGMFTNRRLESVKSLVEYFNLVMIKY